MTDLVDGLVVLALLAVIFAVLGLASEQAAVRFPRLDAWLDRVLSSPRRDRW